MSTTGILRLGRRTFGPAERLVMAIVNRTPDSFYDRGATWHEDAAMRRVHLPLSTATPKRALHPLLLRRPYQHR